jgi:hypothetical protein
MFSLASFSRARQVVNSCQCLGVVRSYDNHACAAADSTLSFGPSLGTLLIDDNHMTALHTHYKRSTVIPRVTSVLRILRQSRDPVCHVASGSLQFKRMATKAADIAFLTFIIQSRIFCYSPLIRSAVCQRTNYLLGHR